MNHSIHKQKTAIIIGAGPAGLTAAYELLKYTQIKPIVFEASSDIGGLSRTIVYKGNRIDIGGHRFFSKSDVIMRWWSEILPIENTKVSQRTLKYQGKSRQLTLSGTVDPTKTDNVMLLRKRLSRIYYQGKFYNYPISLDSRTIRNLGFTKIIKIGASYLKARLKPVPEKSLEDFYINHFGRELYRIFFRDYTKKVWGVPCTEIAADWGAQRVKGLSIGKTAAHAVKEIFIRSKPEDISQKSTESSLIEYFLYPKLGPGHMWETVAEIIIRNGGEIHREMAVSKVYVTQDQVKAVEVFNQKSKKTERREGDFFLSTMPVKELIASFKGVFIPQNVQEVAEDLPYRDFITVGLLLRGLKLANTATQNTEARTVLDNWIYVQDSSVKVGRLQIFNNWSPYLVRNKKYVWLGMEYFAEENDELWSKTDAEMSAFAAEELAKINIINRADILDSTVIRVKKAYPAYTGSYKRFSEIQQYTDRFENLFLLGRNGQHRYNNQDHSMLTAIEAVRNIKVGRKDKANVWDVNLEKEYHEED